ncbi:MAG: hypothetical protein PHE88_02420 [Elusimicrobia bacterium]|nr:hypothetical protein [Elusimicrobiota bacterium]
MKYLETVTFNKTMNIHSRFRSFIFVIFIFLFQVLLLTCLCADAWDSTDDSAENGTVITPTSETQSHGPHDLAATDTTDWFKISMTSGTAYYFSFTNYLNNCNAYLYSDSTGTNLVTFKLSGNPFKYTAALSQTYYLKLKPSNISWTGYLNYRSTNTAPVISWTEETDYASDGLNPETGGPSTIFIYRVKYSDTNNDAPRNPYPRVYITTATGGAWNSYLMNEVDINDITYSDGKLYTYSTRLSSGTGYKYYFVAYDRWGTLATGATISVEAPDVLAPQLITISGYIKDSNGTPANDVLAGLTESTTQISASTTDINGYYEFKNVLEGGDYTIMPAKSNYNFTPSNRAYGNLSSNQTNQNYISIPIEDAPKGSAGWTTELITNRLAYTGLDWSNSGIIYLSDTESKRDLYIMNSDGTSKKRLTNDEYINSGAKFVPGQNKIAYIRKTDTDANSSICIMGLGGSGKTVIYTSTLTINSIKVSPDGSKIAIVENTGILSVINADGTGHIYLAESLENYLSWAPDSNSIVYYDTGSSTSEIRIITSTGGASIYLCDGIYPDWSSNNKIVYRDNSSPDYYLYTINPDGTGNSKLTLEPKSYSGPKWSPDGLKIYYKTDSNGIYEINADGTGDTNILDYSEYNTFNFFGFSPESDQIGYASVQNIYTLKTDGTGNKNLTNNILPYGFELVDISEKVVYIADFEGKKELRTIDQNSKNDTLIEMTTTNYTITKLSPDGTKIAYSYLYDGQYRVKVKDIYGSAMWSNSSSSSTTNISWSHESKGIVFNSGTELYLSDFSTLVELVLSPDILSGISAFSADGTKVVFNGTINGVSGLYIMNPDGTNKQRIASGSTPLYSPVGQRLAYINGRNLWVYENGLNQQVTTAGDLYSLKSWSEDGTKIICRDSDDTSYKIVDIVSGSVNGLNTFTDIDWYGLKIVYNEDLYQGRNIYAIVMSNPDGTERKQLAPASYVYGYGSPKFSYDGKRVFYLHGRDICFATISSAFKTRLEQDHILPVNNVINPTKGDICRVYYNTTIPGHITIKLYTIDGIFIKSLVDNDVVAGTYSVDWYGKNSGEDVVASGIYYVHIEGPGFKQTKKICIVK